MTQLTQDEKLLQESVAMFAKTRVAPQVAEMDTTGHLPPSLREELFAQGLCAIQVDEQYGGVGASFMSTVLAIETLSQTDPSVGLLCDLQNTVICNVMQQQGSEVQREEWLPRMTSSTVRTIRAVDKENGET